MDDVTSRDWTQYKSVREGESSDAVIWARTDF